MMMFLSPPLSALSGPESSCLSTQGEARRELMSLPWPRTAPAAPSVTVLSRVVDDSLKDTRRPFTRHGHP